MLASWKKSYDQPRQCIKKQRHYFADKGLSSQSYGFSSSHVWMWELDYKESWAWKNWWFWTVVLEKTLESPLDCKEIQPVSPKGSQFWIFIGRTDAEAEIPNILATWCEELTLEKDPESGKDWRPEEKGTTEDEIVEWHYWLDGHEFEQALGSWWWTGKPGVLQSMGSQRVRDDWATELTDWLNFHTEFDRVWESPEIVYRVDVSVYFSAFVIFPRVVLVIPKHICFKITLFCVLCIVCSNYTKLQ